MIEEEYPEDATISVAQLLDDYANHFVHSDWNYTRNHEIKSIRYTNDTDTLRHRLNRGWRFLTSSKKHGLIYDHSLRWRIRLFFHSLRRDDNLPDGSLDSGGVLVYWEENGEYIQLVQPSVGALLATFLKECPKHKHAKLITAELERIRAGYSERLSKEGNDNE